MIVHDCTVAFPSRDGAETIVGVVLTHGTELAKFGCECDFCLRSLEGLLLQPIEETCQRHRIFAHGDAFACEFGVIFHTHHLQHGTRAHVHTACNSRIDGLVECFIHFATIIHNSLCLNMLQVIKYLIIILYAYVDAIEVCTSGIIQFVRCYEDGAFLHLHYHITDEAWGIVHIFATDIQQPTNLVQCRHYQRIAMLLAQGLTHTCQLTRHALACVFLLILVKQ